MDLIFMTIGRLRQFQPISYKSMKTQNLINSTFKFEKNSTLHICNSKLKMQKQKQKT